MTHGYTKTTASTTARSEASTTAAGTETTASGAVTRDQARIGQQRDAGQRRDVYPPAAEAEAVNLDSKEAGQPASAGLPPEDPLVWRVMISALYHQKRERFLDGVDRFSQAIGMLGGAAAFASAFNTAGGFSIPGAVVAVVGAGALCYGPGAKARRHAEFARDYKSLHASVVRCGTPTTEQRCEFEAQVLLLEANEPAALGALTTQCHNELCTALDRRHEITPLRWYERLFANWFDFDQTARLSENPTSPIDEHKERQAPHGND